MRLPRTVSFILVAALGACDSPRPVVVLDGYTSVISARLSCLSSLGLSHREACLVDPAQEVRNFEVGIATQVAVAPECKSVLFVRSAGPNEKDNKAVSDAMRPPYWMLLLQFEPAAQKQHWSLWRSTDLSPPPFAQGDDGPTEIAKKVCAIAKQQGGTIVR